MANYVAPAKGPAADHGVTTPKPHRAPTMKPANRPKDSSAVKSGASNKSRGKRRSGF